MNGSLKYIKAVMKTDYKTANPSLQKWFEPKRLSFKTYCSRPESVKRENHGQS